MDRDRARGVLLGLAVGDALGTTYEFRRIEQPAYPVLATGPAIDVVGGGPFEVPPGAVTDDTQMAVCLARSLKEHGRLDVADVTRRYQAWMREAFDIGSQTRGSLASSGIAYWRSGGLQAAGNGSLMRTAPLAVALASAPAETLRRAVLAESMITHADPRCSLACAGFDAAIAAAISGAHSPTAMLAACSSAIEHGASELRAMWSAASPAELAAVTEARDVLRADLDEVSGAPVAGMTLHDQGGFVRTSFRLAFWHLAHTPSWRDAVVDVASRGGDADTNAAIVGALLGARDGASAIPAVWIDRVLSATQKGPAAWGEMHHPRHLLALAE